MGHLDLFVLPPTMDIMIVGITDIKSSIKLSRRVSVIVARKCIRVAVGTRRIRRE